MYEEGTDSVFLDRPEDKAHDFDWRKTCSGNAAQYEEEYDHPVWKKYIQEGGQGGHDGMDWLEFQTFFSCLRENSPMPVDVYDAASWMAVTALFRPFQFLFIMYDRRAVSVCLCRTEAEQ